MKEFDLHDVNPLVRIVGYLRIGTWSRTRGAQQPLHFCDEYTKTFEELFGTGVKAGDVLCVNNSINERQDNPSKTPQLAKGEVMVLYGKNQSPFYVKVVTIKVYADLYGGIYFKGMMLKRVSDTLHLTTIKASGYVLINTT